MKKIDSNKINKDRLEQQINNFKDEITNLNKQISSLNTKIVNLERNR
ncbi:hypothetical protein ['Camptotheca acuminata' phytoplasma]